VFDYIDTLKYLFCSLTTKIYQIQHRSLSCSGQYEVPLSTTLNDMHAGVFHINPANIPDRDAVRQRAEANPRNQIHQTGRGTVPFYES